MPQITKEYYESLKQRNLLFNGDWHSIAKLTRQAGLREGKGFTRQRIRQVVVESADTCDELVALVRTFYESRMKAHQEQLEMAQKIKEMNNF